MTEYDAFAIYEEQQRKNKISAIEANNGLISIYFKDGTIEVWKSGWFGRLKKVKSRTDA